MRHRHPMLRRPLRVSTALERLFTTEQFTFRQILRMFLPLLLDQLFIFGIGILSTAMVSSSGESALTAVTLVAPINATVTALFSALGTGGTILVARACGSGDKESLRAAVGQSMLLITLSAALCTAVLYPFSTQIIQLVYPATNPGIQAEASLYMRLVGLSFIPYGIFNSAFGTFRGIGEVKSSLFLTLTINLSHLALTFLLVNVLRLGIAGSGWAYVVARGIGAVVAAVWIFVVRNTMRVRARHIFRFSRKLQAAALSLSMPIAFEQILFQFSALVIQMIIAQLPAASTAAFGLANSAFNLYNSVAFALTSITMTLCGQCLGARKPGLAAHYCGSMIRAGRWLLLAASLIISPLMPLILRMYHPSAEVMPQALHAVWISAAAMPLLWCDANVSGAAMRAAGDGSYVMVASLLAMWAGRIAAGYLVGIVLGVGVVGFWIGLALEWLVRGLILRPRLRSGRWLRKVLAAERQEG